ncbi:MAG: hypothetical protein PHN51_04755 [Candidatus Nanopelagicales bacterium]|nr:hypothetical protein [Candidatus Nanopelagicales bacterium]
MTSFAIRRSGSANDFQHGVVASHKKWRDTRIWVGLGFIIAAMFIGAFVMSSGGSTSTVWRATRDLPVGAVPEVEAVTVALGEAATTYLPTTELPQGRMKLPVADGGFLPRNAVGAAVPSNSRLVTIPVDPMRVPVGLAAGDVVDVWASAPKVNEASSSIPTQVLSNVLVADVDREASGMGGELPVVLDIADSQAAQLIGATRADISLVLVPLPSQSFYGEISQ